MCACRTADQGLALQALARQRDASGELRLDAVKLSHQGSRANVTNDLLAVVRADHYVFSTNGAIFHHPDDEAVARVLVHGGFQPTIWSNYETERNRRWNAADLRARYRSEVRYPEPGQTGVTLAIAARRL